MSLARGQIVGLVAAVVVAAGGWAFVRAENARLAATEQPARRDQPIDAVPRDALLLVTLDLARLRAAGLADEVLAAGRDVPGLGDVRAACGFDPVTSFAEVALAVPDLGFDGDFGVIASGSGVPGEQLLACTSKVIEARGGRPVSSTIGTFRTVRDVSLEVPGGEIAARPGGPLVLLGAGAYLRAMVDAAEGAIPSARQNALHTRLRAALGDDAAVRATLVLGAQQRKAIADEVAQAGSELAPPAVARVGAVGAAIAFDADRVAVHAVLACDDGRAALEVVSAIERVRGAQAANPLIRLAGFGAALDGIELEVERDLVHARVVLARVDAEALVARLVGARAAAPVERP